MTDLSDRMNGTGLPKPPPAAPVFDAESITMQRRMRFNPLRMLDPENLSTALDQFDAGILYRGALLWDAMIRRDDTLSYVVPALENAVAGKPWGVFKRKNADEQEAARHAAALEYFWDNVTATDAFDRNVRGSRHLLLKQMGRAHALRYVPHHFCWRPMPGKMIEVEGAAPVPALTAELEHVPLWYFENLSGTLRLLRIAGDGLEGEELNWDGEWVCTTGEGLMFASSICYVFKRLTFQDWTVFNERYAQQKVVAQTPAQKDTDPGNAMAQIVGDFNGDQGIVLYESQPGTECPIKLLGPEGTVSVDLFKEFIERQDRKMSVHYRGSDLRTMSREKENTGVSAQKDETESLELAHCANIASACREIDRQVIKFCFGEGVEPLAYFGLPDMDQEDAKQLCESAGFLTDRGALVELDTIAERLGVTLTDDPALALQSAAVAGGPDADPDGKAPVKTANAARLDRLQELVEDALRTVNAYDPDEARDAGGKWTKLFGLYQKLKSAQEGSDVAIAGLHAGSGMPMEELHGHLREMSKRGLAHLTIGEWDRASEAERAAALPMAGERQLRVKILPEAAGHPDEPKSAADENASWHQRSADRARKKAPLPSDEQREIIRDVVNRSHDKSEQEGEDFGAVSDTAVQMAAKAGHDIAGFTKRIEPDAVRHVASRHSDAAIELSRNQVPVTEADYDRLPDVFDAPDAVSAGSTDPDGSPTLVFMKKAGPNFRIIAHVRRGRRRLAFKSLTKERSPAAS